MTSIFSEFLSFLRIQLRSGLLYLWIADPYIVFPLISLNYTQELSIKSYEQRIDILVTLCTLAIDSNLQRPQENDENKE